MAYPDLQKWQVAAALFALAFLALLVVGRYYVADELVQARHRIATLERALDDAREQIAADDARIAVLEREVDVMRGANALLRESERERQDEIADLQADLEFYRRLGGASGSQAPLAVHYLELQATQSPRVYRLIFTLTQNLRWAAVISGRVELGLDGIQDQAAVRLTARQLLPAEAQPIQFRFKYFQQIERLLTLPEGFAPGLLTVRLKATGLRQPVERSAQWQDLFNDASTDADGLPTEAVIESEPVPGGN